ncbi:short-chain dehydrogenase/reductase SDR [Chlorobaculum parvum NCIB 8327]|uniref:Short-chain dehydrogenase/reductase SDR n=1 Tax=Chlorobaculum parvum (strain DSM 263 / NCIMB 8327) TaxID=517417 RepID=B3QP39_CHLP8|nr:3-oxoacyl-ACP reductase family protein [Chlorobaculum parvum]ACF11692.1 short-chain dehydrogenase/reductase SDR [Chlorobaculum parvum NCIB 8327]
MKGRVALVTGASRGIGRATAKLLAAEGAAVAVNYFQSEGAAHAVVDEITQAGGKALAVRADVRDEAQVQAMVAEVEQHLGPVDLLVSNASIGFPVKPFTQFAWDEFEAKLTGELKSIFFCSQAVLPGMIEQKSGSIIAISSTLSRHSSPGFIVHSTAKSGLDAFVRSLAEEVGAFGIRVNVIAPGLTLTDATAWLPDDQKAMMADMTPLKRVALPEDVAGAVLAVASDHSRFVTGCYIPVSGGMFML